MTEQSVGNQVTMKPSDEDMGQVDRYTLLKKLGQGGFGAVFKAYDNEVGINVALKALPDMIANLPEELEGVRKNFALVSRLAHPAIATVRYLHRIESMDGAATKALGLASGAYVLVMDYIEGSTLSAWRTRFPGKRVPLDVATVICRQIAAALDYAHKRKIVHRDIKPSNVMIDVAESGAPVSEEAGGVGVGSHDISIKVLDFGLAAEIRSSMSRVSQEQGDTSGTRPYMAPEQWVGRRQGAYTDQYALAVLFYELVSGEVPFSSVFETGDMQLMRDVVKSEAVEALADQPPPVNQALIKALSKEPSDRFTCCKEFVSALEQGGIRKKNRGMGIVVGALACLLSVGGAWWFANSVSGPTGAQHRGIPVDEPREMIVDQTATPLVQGRASEGEVNQGIADTKPVDQKVEQQEEVAEPLHQFFDSASWKEIVRSMESVPYRIPNKFEFHYTTLPHEISDLGKALLDPSLSLVTVWDKRSSRLIVRSVGDAEALPLHVIPIQDTIKDLCVLSTNQVVVLTDEGLDFINLRSGVSSMTTSFPKGYSDCTFESITRVDVGSRLALCGSVRKDQDEEGDESAESSVTGCVVFFSTSTAEWETRVDLDFEPEVASEIGLSEKEVLVFGEAQKGKSDCAVLLFGREEESEEDVFVRYFNDIGVFERERRMQGFKDNQAFYYDSEEDYQNFLMTHITVKGEGEGRVIKKGARVRLRARPDSFSRLGDSIMWACAGRYLTAWNIETGETVVNEAVVEHDAFTCEKALLDESTGILRLGGNYFSVPDATMNVRDDLVSDDLNIGKYRQEEGRFTIRSIADNPKLPSVSWDRAYRLFEAPPVFFTSSDDGGAVICTHYERVALYGPEHALMADFTNPPKSFGYATAAFSRDNSLVVMLPGNRFSIPDDKNADLGRWLPDGSAMQPFYVYSVDSGERLYSGSGGMKVAKLPNIAAISPSKKFIAVGARGKEVVLISTETWEPVWREENDNISCLAFDKAGNLLIGRSTGYIDRYFPSTEALEKRAYQTAAGGVADIRPSLPDGSMMTILTGDRIVEFSSNNLKKRKWSFIPMGADRWVFLSEKGIWAASDPALADRVKCVRAGAVIPLESLPQNPAYFKYNLLDYDRMSSFKENGCASAEDYIFCAQFMKAAGQTNLASQCWVKSVEHSDSLPDNARSIFKKLVEGGFFREADLVARQMIEKADESHKMELNGVAWSIATQGGYDEDLYASALDCARKAVSFAPEDPRLLDTLAAAYASIGLFSEAVETQKHAIRLLPEKNDKGYSYRLDLYKRGLVFRKEK